jgi:hypothetical protein
MLSWNSRTEQQQTSFLITAAVAASLPLAYYSYTYLRPQNRKQYPPGPPGIPIIGNLFQLPSPSSGGLVDDKLLEWYVADGLLLQSWSERDGTI